MTGHRHVGGGRAFKRILTEILEDVQPDAFIQGLAIGADLLSGKVAIDMGIPVISAMPYPTHIDSIPHDWKELYRWVRDHSEEVYPVSEVDEYLGPWVYFRRNEWMIDEADRLLAWYDGRNSGGTKHAIGYANKTGKPVRNIYAKD